MSSTLPPWYHPIHPRPAVQDVYVWDRLPKRYPHRPGEWFFIGQLAEALGRSVRTLHRWEVAGWLPRTPYLEEGVCDLDGYEDTAGRRRLYTFEMIEVVERIADEEGLLGTRRCCPANTRFPIRVAEAWEDLEQLLDQASQAEPAAESTQKIRPWPDVVAEVRARR